MWMIKDWGAACSRNAAGFVGGEAANTDCQNLFEREHLKHINGNNNRATTTHWNVERLAERHQEIQHKYGNGGFGSKCQQ